MLKKTQVKRTGRVRVTFRYAAADARSVAIAGQFNDWQPVEMKRAPDGAWQAVLELEPDRAYEFRYLIDGQRWANDPAADRCVPNPFGGENCVAVT
ncbi:MAG: isoamylase early set domain-containing protein [Gemmatimonadota bacterium]